MTSDLPQRVVEVRQRIEAARPAGSKPVTLVAVTKAFGVDAVHGALAAGLCDLGENYAQELEAKAGQLGGEAGTVRWHFIGGLQRNKVKQVRQRVYLWQTVDRVALVDEIAKRSPGAGVLIQVNTTGEESKSGCEPGRARELVDRARDAGLDARGLMTVGPTSPSTDPRPAFEQLRLLGDRCEVDELSMGMSNDFELAVSQGSTMVRIGSALFGPRPAAPGPMAAVPMPKE